MGVASKYLVLVARKSSDKCSGSNKHKADCETPVNDDAMTIGLGVGIPVFVILCVLGVLLYRTYRRNKKEAMEHDPDFDENGEATALPDFPNSQQTYQLENPFHNRNSVRYPQGLATNKSNTSLNKSEHSDVYGGGIVLPYHHDTGSKASLDLFARHLSEFNSHGGQGPAALSRTRNSSFTNASNFQMPYSNSVSPQKSSLRDTRGALDRSPTKSVGGATYTNVPDRTVADSESVSLELASNSDSSGSEVLARGANGEKFGLNYENESTSSFAHKEEYTRQGTSSNTTTDQSSTWDEKEHAVPQFTINGPEGEEVAEKIETERSPFNDSHVASVEYEDEDNEAESHADDVPIEEEQKLESPVKVKTTLTPESKPVRSKSPRISAFNLLQNDSDDENADEKVLSAEQEEELKRMKSVYKVYFDRENSTRRPGAEAHEFKYDDSHALPQIDPEQMDRLKINNELHTNTNYDKRLTATSSIYDNAEDMQQPYNANYYGQPGPYAPSPYNQYQHYELYQPPADLPKLQQLPSASDIRKSTIQTYTDFQPRSKNPVNTPRQPFVPIENVGVWSSPSLLSPQLQSAGTFGPLTTSLPTYQEGQSGPTVPSATQMSRSSVVMLNPVTEITKQRTFRPAGSLPGNNSPYIPTGFNQSESDLIPNNRKSDVRRMMNTNF